jgi:hypothetical protein
VKLLFLFFLFWKKNETKSFTFLIKKYIIIELDKMLSPFDSLFQLEKKTWNSIEIWFQMKYNMT